MECMFVCVRVGGLILVPFCCSLIQPATIAGIWISKPFRYGGYGGFIKRPVQFV